MIYSNNFKKNASGLSREGPLSLSWVKKEKSENEEKPAEQANQNRPPPPPPPANLAQSLYSLLNATQLIEQLSPYSHSRPDVILDVPSWTSNNMMKPFVSKMKLSHTNRAHTCIHNT